MYDEAHDDNPGIDPKDIEETRSTIFNVSKRLHSPIS